MWFGAGWVAADEGISSFASSSSSAASSVFVLPIVVVVVVVVAVVVVGCGCGCGHGDWFVGKVSAASVRGAALAVGPLRVTRGASANGKEGGKER